jgi:hypothetical protein
MPLNAVAMWKLWKDLSRFFVYKNQVLASFSLGSSWRKEWWINPSTISTLVPQHIFHSTLTCFCPRNRFLEHKNFPH